MKKAVIMQKLKRVITFLGKVMTVLSIVYIAWNLYQSNMDWSLFSDPYKVCLCILGLSCLVVIGDCINAYVWKRYLDFFTGQTNTTFEIMDLYLRSNIAKYLPGNVVQYMGRNMLGKELGLSQKRIFLATVAELICIVLCNTSFAFIVSFQKAKEVIGYIYVEHHLAVYAVFGGIMAVLALIFLTVFMIQGKYWKGKGDLIKKFLILLLFVCFMYLLGFLLSAMTLWLAFSILGEKLNYSDVASANALSWLVGYLVPGAPGGIGIRELVLMWLLKWENSAEVISLAALMVRICSIVGDFLAFSGTWIISRLRKRRICTDA